MPDASSKVTLPSVPELLSILSSRFEILWVYKNYKAFKKVLFTMEKYPQFHPLMQIRLRLPLRLFPDTRFELKNV